MASQSEELALIWIFHLSTFNTLLQPSRSATVPARDPFG